MMNQLEIGKLIRELRLKITLTQEKFAALGISYPTISCWENNRAQPSPMALKLIEKMLLRLDDHGKELITKHFPKD